MSLAPSESSFAVSIFTVASAVVARSASSALSFSLFSRSFSSRCLSSPSHLHDCSYSRPFCFSSSACCRDCVSARSLRPASAVSSSIFACSCALSPDALRASSSFEASRLPIGAKREREEAE